MFPAVVDAPETTTVPAVEDTEPLHDGLHGMGGVTTKHSPGVSPVVGYAELPLYWAKKQ
jgi:hypothetical protein